MDVPDLLPPDSGLVLRQVTISPAVVGIVAKPTRPSAARPRCAGSSDRVHGHYTRTIADLPWQGRRVILRPIVRRFKCPTGGCPWRTFTERLPVVAPNARATARLTEAHRAIGFALST